MTPQQFIAKHDKLIQDLVERLAHVRVLAPDCGSGNSLYVSIHLLLSLERGARTRGGRSRNDPCNRDAGGGRTEC